jgi:hypothetical protein
LQTAPPSVLERAPAKDAAMVAASASSPGVAEPALPAHPLSERRIAGRAIDVAIDVARPVRCDPRRERVFGVIGANIP